MAFKDVLVQLRQQRGWSQQDLADAAEVHVQIVKRYEAGQSLPTLDTLARIARCLGVSTDVLVFDEGGGIAGNVLDDAELLDLFRQIGRLRAQEREAIRVVLRGLVEYAKVRGPEEVKEPKEPPAPKRRVRRTG